MDKVLHVSKNVLITVGLGRLIVKLGVLWKLGSTTFSVHSRQLHLLPNYTNTGDHLFIQPTFSVRKQFFAETIIVLMVFLTGFMGLTYALSLLFALNILVVVSLLIAFFYFVFFVFKLYVIVVSLFTEIGQVSTAEVAALGDAELPMYSVFIPLRDEAEVVDQVVSAITAIDYPPEKLDVVITVEQFDTPTIEALAAANIPSNWRVLKLPDTAPKTKPKAMNCAFLEAKGEFLVIFDAEIMPESTQLKKALVMFQRHKKYAALQPRLDHYNTNQNLITRLFTIEFNFHYDLFLPGLMKLGLPVPLSGHSTHFRTGALRRAGAWDPYNVAEDCEIGMRLFRLGYRAGFLDSVSQEEAASSIKSWVAQRTRWMKGFIQTSIVHLRYPRLTLRQMGGWRNFLAFLLLVPGTVLINILNLFLYASRASTNW